MLMKEIKILQKKRKKKEYDRTRHKNLSKDEKQRLVEYRRNYYIRLKNKGGTFLTIRVKMR